VGFAANSLLCRAALLGGTIDAATFTTVRLVSGAATLALLSAAAGRRIPRGGSLAGALLLFTYAACFSYAYLRLAAGHGALLLFGAVQLTMIGWGLGRGERPRRREWGGWLVAVVGLVTLARPGLEAPDPAAAGLMAAAGVAWGAYSLSARGAGSPLHATAGNFLRAVPLAAILSLATLTSIRATPRGILLSALSGSLASGVGYALWYAALRQLTATRAALVQLAVPVVAAAGGVLLLGESISLRLVASGAAIVGGLGLALLPLRRT
jgi:drug/metabolite transporter (DMT)-like permease